MAYLNFIADKDLIRAVGNVIDKIERAEESADKNLYKNVINPFSAIFDGVTHYISYDKWIIQERARQT